MELPSTSAAAVRMNYTLKDKIFLIGHMSFQITGSKLPSNRQVLSSMFYNIREVKLNIKHAARVTIQEVLVFWEKAKIPTKYNRDCVVKLTRMYDGWRKLQKSATRSASFAQNRKAEAFESTLDDLFDVAHQHALENNTEEGKQFLLLQRQKRRVDCIGGVDMKFVQAEQRRQKRRSAEIARLQKSKTNLENKNLEVENILSTSSTSQEDPLMQNDVEENFTNTRKTRPVTKKRKYFRGTEEIPCRKCQ